MKRCYAATPEKQQQWNSNYQNTSVGCKLGRPSGPKEGWIIAARGKNQLSAYVAIQVYEENC